MAQGTGKNGNWWLRAQVRGFESEHFPFERLRRLFSVLNKESLKLAFEYLEPGFDLIALSVL